MSDTIEVDLEFPDGLYKKPCNFHPDREAAGTCVIVDRNASGIHTVEYKRVPVCWSCARERQSVNTARVEWY